MKNTYQQQFRVIPSAIPLKSPSPDHKSSNNLTPTKSPNTIQIKKNITPPKVNVNKPKTENISFDLSTNIKYQTHSPSYPNNNEQSTMQQKDEIIKQLKNIINLITQNSRHGKTSDDTAQLKNQIKILTIENQKLVNIIEKGKVGKQQTLAEQTLHQLSQYERQISQLMQTIKFNQNQHEQEMNEIKRLYKNTMNHCKNVEDENKELTRESEKLIKLLKQDRQQKQKLRSSDLSEEQESDSKIGTKSTQKITLIKIKEQYAQNIRLLKEQMQEKIREKSQTMNIVLNDMDIKSSTVGNRLQSIEKIVWDRVKTGQRIKKSQIYIEQAPSSSSQHEKVSKDEFTSRVLYNQLQEKLLNVTSQLEELRFKYEKMSLDNSAITYSKREAPTNNDLLQEQLREKEREVKALQSQNMMLSSGNSEEVMILREKISITQSQVEKREEELKSIHEAQIIKIRSQTQIKVKLLVQNYEKELQMLRKDIVIKSASLSDISDMTNQEKLQLLHTVEVLNNQIQKSMNEQKATKAQMQKKIILQQIQYNDVLSEKNMLSKRIAQLMGQVQERKQGGQGKQKEIIMQMMEINKYKSDSEQLGQLNEMLKEQNSKLNGRIQELQLQVSRQGPQRQNMRKELIDKHKQIMNIKEQIYDNKVNIKEQLQDIKAIIQSNSSTSTKEITQMKYTIQELNLKLINKTQQINTHVKQYNALSQTITQKESIIIGLREKVGELQKLNELYKLQIKNNKDKYEQLLGRMESMERGSIEEVNTRIVQVQETNNEVYQALRNKLIGLIQIQDKRFNNIQNIIHQ